MTQHVVVGAGPVGLAVVDVLQARGADSVVVTRDSTPDLPDGVEHRHADVVYPDDAVDAFAGADVVYQCSQPSYEQWVEEFPDLIHGVIAGVEAADARLVVADNLYMYGPAETRLTEDLPYLATGPKGQTRADCANLVFDAHEAGRIEATIGRASDFFGPRVRDSVVGEQVFGAAVAGRRATVFGDPQLAHTYTYVPDFARALVFLGERDEALGEAWHVPNPETVSTRRFVELVYDAADTDPGFPHIVAVSDWLLTLGALVSSPLGELAEMRYAFEEPYVVLDTKFRDTFGDAVEPTPLEDAIAETVAWYRDQQARGEPETEPVHIETTPSEAGESA
ncbi:3-beta hydroxysteroid dehydrogenase/isomerase family protein [Haloferax mucosum ATCC BAA-1512]|uniref:3-beta hydroxysteroid dehydrogenase/isomerase family protein n=1 Tax=Haloferax mucosum ATCC BAA-1512 TaxID=662479 RepID=M0I8Y2_9EURY|nr:NAD-dependent epimerase/dehydratase family protein [Haloferax mucosum]ELZ91899.1 3-beta hydroxysteroid dehydrogenase/isomerase family protein [Haloferax mucosum ATCC BAA-1512]